MLAESLWAAGEVVAAVEALEQSAAAAESMTMSHGLLMLHLGPLEDATEWLSRFADEEPDPQRAAMARLGISRALAWDGAIGAAQGECDRAAALLSASRVSRFDLLIRCQATSIAGDVEAAVLCLEEARARCAPFESAEAAVDVGEALVRCKRPPSSLVERYLTASSSVLHRGIKHRLESLRSALALTIGEDARAHEYALRAETELARLLERLPDSYRETILLHPWLRQQSRIRAVP
jgi:hypothetical protein